MSSITTSAVAGSIVTLISEGGGSSTEAKFALNVSVNSMILSSTIGIATESEVVVAFNTKTVLAGGAS